MTTATLSPLAGAGIARGPAPSASMFERVACASCGETAATRFIEGEDDLTGRPGRFQFVRCAACGLVYQNPRLTLEHVKSYYDESYIAHRRVARRGPMAPLFNAAMSSLDRTKLRLVERHVRLDSQSVVLDVGCGAGSFLAHARARTGASIVGVDFIDLSRSPSLHGAEFHHGLFYEQAVGGNRFDLITMWHFLEHDYDPLRSLRHAREALVPGGRLLVEVPRLDSLSFTLYGHRWPGLQAPQHTVLFDRQTLVATVERAGLTVDTYLPYGAFPPYFYLFCGLAFRLRRGRGLDLDRAMYAYFAGQVALLPILPVLKHLNFAMQTVVCRRA
jgi:SAM-dependent methyltransferase